MTILPPLDKGQTNDFKSGGSDLKARLVKFIKNIATHAIFDFTDLVVFGNKPKRKARASCP